MDQILVYLGFAGGGYLAYVMYKAQNKEANANADKLVCPHCQTAGHIKVTVMQRKKGISGGKATGALMTGGVSMAATGLSRKQKVRHMRCGNCSMEWDVE